MYKYEFARIKCNVSGYILTSGTVFGLPDHKSIILTKAEDGWRYIGYIPVK